MWFTRGIPHGGRRVNMLGWYKKSNIQSEILRKWYSFKSISSNRTVENCQTLSMHGMMSSLWSSWPVWVCNHRSRPGANFFTVICMRLFIFVTVRHRFQYFVVLVSLCNCTHCWPVWSLHPPTYGSQCIPSLARASFTGVLSESLHRFMLICFD